ncbi:MAG: asparagine synthase (glutamine-hydrolyzing) [Vicinamibacterales bacterium]
MTRRRFNEVPGSGFRVRVLGSVRSSGFGVRGSGFGFPVRRSWFAVPGSRIAVRVRCSCLLHGLGNLEPRTPNPEPRTDNPEPRTPNGELNPEHEPGTRNLEPGTWNPEPCRVAPVCGIFGHLSRDGSPVPVADCRRLTGLLHHRGPDEGGYWHEPGVFLGNRRLAIIDVRHAHQPMASADGRLVVTFNGEIYNYIELRTELSRLGHAFRYHSDTEVLLAGYREWGTALASRLVGQFACAIYDRLDRTLWLARDPLGEKPLLYRDTASAVTFASELAPIAASMRPEERAIDREALGGYLCLNYVPGDRTMMAGVRRVPAGTWRLYGPSGVVTTGVYWIPPQSPAIETDDPEDVQLDRLQARVDEAVALALRSDVPVGLFLSGGIDSTVIAESAARQGAIARAFCLDMADAGFSEWPAAERVSRQIGVPLVRVPFDCTVIDRFLDVVDHADDPLADSSALAVWTISLAAAEDVKVVLTGDGGDELFGGYLTYAASRLHARYVERLPRGLRRALAASAERLPVNDREKVSATYKLQRFLRAAHLSTREAHFTWNGTWMPADAAGLLRDPAAARAAATALRDMADRHGLNGAPATFDLQRADLRDYLPNDILVKVDRMSMAHGLETRAPFLNPALVAFALGLPEHLRVSRGSRTKVLLRSLCRRHFGPEIAGAKKKGFSIPIHQWLRGPARARLQELLAPSAIDAIGLLDAGRVSAAVADHLEGRRSLGWELWGLMVLSAWHDSRVRRPAEPADLPEPSALVDVSARMALPNLSRA